MSTPERTERLQRLFDKSLNHIRKQGRPCFVFDGDHRRYCKYKLGELGCAGAPFITKYTDEMEGYNFNQIAALYPNSIHLDALMELDFVWALQSAHDISVELGLDKFMEFYETLMESISTAYGVTYTPPAE